MCPLPVSYRYIGDPVSYRYVGDVWGFRVMLHNRQIVLPDDQVEVLNKRSSLGDSLICLPAEQIRFGSGTRTPLWLLFLCLPRLYPFHQDLYVTLPALDSGSVQAASFG